MEFNRNQFFMIGLVLVFLGVQLRNVESYTLNDRASHFLTEKIDRNMPDSEGSMRPFLASVGPTPRRTVHPPEWLGFAILSVGSVLVLHSLAMKKPGG